MSLINQMLQDLDKRRASGSERRALPNQVRALPPERTARARWMPLAIAGVLLVAAVIAWTLSNQPLQAPVPTPDVARTTPVPANAAASRLTLELERLPTVGNPAATPSAERNEPKSRPAQGLAVPAAGAPSAMVAVIASTAKTPSPAHPVESVKVPEAVPAKAPVLAPAPAETPAAPAKPVAAAAPVTVSAPAARAELTASNAQIDKRSQQLTPQQLAENEYRVAANFLNDGRLPEAQEGFRRAIQHFPGHSGARQGLFGLLLDAKKNTEAERVLQDGLRLNPNQPGFAMAVARLQLDREDMSGAIETLQKTAPVALSSPEYVAFMAALFQRTSRHTEAVEHYRTALRLAPGSGVWWMGLGISLQALNRNAEAQDAFRRAKAANTLNPELLAFVDQRLKQLQ